MTATQTFLNASSFAVAGASRDRSKYGNKVFRALRDSGRDVYPINPTATHVENQAAFPSLLNLEAPVESVSIVTPPTVTRRIVADAIVAGVKNIWMQPGAEDEQASRQARDAGLNVIDDGSCILVHLSLEKRRQ